MPLTYDQAERLIEAFQSIAESLEKMTKPEEEVLPIQTVRTEEYKSGD